MANHEGMMEAILGVLVNGTALSRGAACSALVEATFRNAENALLVAKTPGMMQGVVAVMQCSVGDVKDDAAGVLRNCSNYSQEAAEVIVRTPGVLDALVEMCKGQHNSDRFTAMGTIQNLTRCDLVVPLLRQTRVVADALLPSLCADGSGEEHDVMRAEALMAITNLTSEKGLRALLAEPEVMSVIVQMLRCAVRGQAWRDVAWYDAEECLRPLARLSLNFENARMLADIGLVQVLASLLGGWLCKKAEALPARLRHTAGWSAAPAAAASRRAAVPMPFALLGFDQGVRRGQEGAQDAQESRARPLDDQGREFDGAVSAWIALGEERASVRKESAAGGCEASEEDAEFVPREVDLAVLALANIARNSSARERMRDSGIARLLRAVAVAARNHRTAGTPACSADLWVLEERHLAVLMGQHARLGVHSHNWLMSLDVSVLWLIMQDVATVAIAADALADALTAPTSAPGLASPSATGSAVLLEKALSEGPAHGCSMPPSQPLVLGADSTNAASAGSGTPTLAAVAQASTAGGRWPWKSFAANAKLGAEDPCSARRINDLTG
jgi:hypothetical protein